MKKNESAKKNFDPYDPSGSASGNTGNAMNKEVTHTVALNRRNIIICLIVLAAFAIYTLASNQPSGMGPLPGATAFGVVGLDGTEHKFSYDDVTSLELGEDFTSFDKGSCISGTESKRYYSGTFQNESFGEYQLHVDLKIKHYIVVQTDEMIIVFNYESNDTTDSMYDALLGYVPA